MHSKLIDWSNGWHGVELALNKKEIDHLISLLEGLKHDPDQHFHISSDYEGSGEIGRAHV